MFTQGSTVNSSSAVYVPTGYSMQFRMDAVASVPSESDVLSPKERSKLEESLRRHEVSLRLLGQ